MVGLDGGEFESQLPRVPSAFPFIWSVQTSSPEKGATHALNIAVEGQMFGFLVGAAAQTAFPLS